MTKNNDEVASRMRTLLLATTSGEWSHERDREDWSMGSIVAISDGRSTVLADVADSAQAYEDAAFIVEAHNQMSALLDEHDALKGALERAEPALWIMATSRNADAVAIHQEVRSILRAALKETPR